MIKQILRLGVVLGLAAIACWLSPGIARAANDPFVCASGFYQVISDGGGGHLKHLDPVSGNYMDNGTATDTYNAIGYNPLDNYIYGIDTSIANLGNLVKIGSDGTLTDLGAVSGLPVSGYVNGSMDSAGHLYIRSDIHTIQKIDVNAVTATAITTTGDAIVNGSENIFVGNKLYLIVGTSLSIVDLNTNIVTTATVNGPAGWSNPGDNFGAGWTDSDGDLFFSHNDTGSVYLLKEVNPTTYTASFIVSGTVTSNNDGASCPSAPNPFSPPTATDDHYTTPYNTTLHEITIPVLHNDTGSGISVTSNTNPSHGTLTLNSDGTFTYTPTNGFTGTDTFNYTITDGFGRTANATVTITVPVLAPSTGLGGPPSDVLADWLAVAGLALMATGKLLLKRNALS